MTDSVNDNTRHGKVGLLRAGGAAAFRPRIDQHLRKTLRVLIEDIGLDDFVPITAADDLFSQGLWLAPHTRLSMNDASSGRECDVKG